MEGPLKLRERQNSAQQGNEEALSALHTRGQGLYREKRYEAALQCFSKTISQDVRAPVAVLDNRAATYTKLGNLRAALNDGRQMIQQEKANCSGYLRTGKTLQLLGNHKMALDIYQMGTRKVLSSDPNFMLLRAQYEKLARQLAPPKAIDPLQMLPLELAEMVLKYLDFRHMIGLLRVSKTWSQLLSSMPGLWTDLDFSNASKPVNLGAVRKYIKCANGTTSRVSLDRFGSNSEKIPRYVAARCARLTDLRIPGGLIGASILEAAPCALNLRTLIISKACQISCDMVSQLLGHFPNLERAKFQSVDSSGNRPASWEVDMPNLHTLVLDTPKIIRRGGRAMNVLDLDALLAKLPNIHTLSVQGWVVPGQRVDFSSLHQLHNLDLSRLTAMLPPRLPSTVRTITMADCVGFQSPVQNVGFSDYDLPQLIRLSLARWHQLSPGDLRACLTPNIGQVTYLNIQGCIALSRATFKELITQGYFEGIEDLVLRSCDVDDEIATLIASKLLRLKTLDLAYTKVTGFGVKALAVGLEGKLDHICLDGCLSTNIDAVNLVRGMGVKVAFGFPDHLSGGRRIIRR